MLILAFSFYIAKRQKHYPVVQVASVTRTPPVVIVKLFVPDVVQLVGLEVKV